jgi:hypothetical protein
MHLQGQNRYQATLFAERLDELIGEVGYNVQSTLEGKHRLIVDAVQNANDLQQLYRMARRSQRQLQRDRMQVLADAGY